ncbi:DUF488 family protein [Methanobrevibacter sp. DSM 116169]|uniref:DUF488 family protein, N3 subclade n=1 Tax=Methanobrevibacter sp. DSM 116169 TaxID=3242727 RepID=UPI0038FC5A3B
MKVFTMGSSGQKAEEFFKTIDENNIEMVLDVRLHNHSQLLGFTKGTDLGFFLDKISSCDYIHDENFCPKEEILDQYRKKEIGWDGYRDSYLGLIDERDMKSIYDKKYNHYDNILLLCSEKSPDTCHRILLAPVLADNEEDITHLH